MRSLKAAVVASTIIGASLVSMPEARADAWSHDCDTCLYVNLVPLYLRHTSSEADVAWLHLDTQGTRGEPGDDLVVENSGGFHLGNEWGARLVIGTGLGNDWRVEIVGTYLQDWQDRLIFFADDFTGTLNLPFQSDFDGFGDSTFWNAHQVNGDRETTFRTYELNLHRNISEHTSVMAGIRLIDYDDAIAIQSIFDQQDDAGVFSTRTSNTAWGLQLGADGVWPLTENFAVGGAIRTGIFTNSLGVDSFASIGTVNTPVVLRDASDSDRRIAFMADTEVFVSFAWNDRASVSLGYQLIGIGGLANAGENMEFRTMDIVDPDNPNLETLDLKRNGFSFINGVTLRIRFGLN